MKGSATVLWLGGDSVYLLWKSLMRCEKAVVRHSLWLRKRQ